MLRRHPLPPYDGYRAERARRHRPGWGLINPSSPRGCQRRLKSPSRRFAHSVSERTSLRDRTLPECTGEFRLARRWIWATSPSTGAWSTASSTSWNDSPPWKTNRVLSARAFDEARPAGRRTYMEVTRYLGVARDNHEALLAVLEHHGATLWAPWSLLRPTFETALLAAWILDPEDGRERRARGLRCEIWTLSSSADIAPPSRRSQTYVHSSRRVSRDPTLGPRRRTGRKPPPPASPRSSRRRGANSPATSTASDGPLSAVSDKTIAAHIPGGADMLLVINDEAFVTAAKTTYFLLIAACQALRRRHNEPSR